MDRDRKFWIVGALLALAFAVGMVLLLTAVFGAPSIGLRCWRDHGDRECAIRQSRFFGFAGNSTVLIPESDIERAVTLRPMHGVGSRGGGDYTVSLELRSGPYRHYPVLSSRCFEPTEAATRRLNAYLGDPDVSAIELHENLWASVLTPFIPVAFLTIVALAAAGWRRRRARS